MKNNDSDLDAGVERRVGEVREAGSDSVQALDQLKPDRQCRCRKRKMKESKQSDRGDEERRL